MFLVIGNGDFAPKIIKKYQNDVFGIKDKIIMLYGCGMSTRDISNNIQELYGFDVSAETISNIINRVISDIKDWQSRPLKPVYVVVFIDGKKEVLRLHIGGNESAKYWLSVMNDLKSRGMQDILIFCTDINKP